MKFTRHSIAALAVFVLTTGTTSASITNGGFETGDLTDWPSSPSGLVDVLTSAPKIEESGVWLPTEGNYFAELIAGDAHVFTLISQEFSVQAGDILTFDAYFDAGDTIEIEDFNDEGYVKVINVADNSETVLYFKSVEIVGDFGSSGWDNVSHVFSASGTFKIEAGVRNVLDEFFYSSLGLDNVKLTTPVPEPASFVMLLTGGLGLVGGAIRRRRAKNSQAV